MATEIEKTFFDTFGIKQREYTQCTLMGCKYVYKNCNNCQYHEVYKIDYPQITDHILLELILINMHHEDLFGYPANIQELKDNTLEQLIETYNKFSTCVTWDGEYQQSVRNIKHQIQELFKGD